MDISIFCQLRTTAKQNVVQCDMRNESFTIYSMRDECQCGNRAGKCNALERIVFVKKYLQFQAQCNYSYLYKRL